MYHKEPSSSFPKMFALAGWLGLDDDSSAVTHFWIVIPAPEVPNSEVVASDSLFRTRSAGTATPSEHQSTPHPAQQDSTQAASAGACTPAFNSAHTRTVDPPVRPSPRFFDAYDIFVADIICINTPIDTAVCQHPLSGTSSSKSAVNVGPGTLPSIQHRSESMSRYNSLTLTQTTASTGIHGHNMRRIQPVDTEVAVTVTVEATPSPPAQIDYTITPIIVVEGTVLPV